ncbi:hypothetical protein ACLVWU_09760 [Bdellovibrio sp. HCB290]|uniref:hypothetical protein n=1 Tax=Bdellovibrio sp. HCB290 TaxID=3394356 RepID=UPI0039B58999
MKITIATTLLLTSILANANPSGYGGGAGHGGKTGPCQKIKAACEAAGFVGGDPKAKKKLWKDCVDPLIEGKSVKGVSVSAADVEACKMK